MSTESVSDEEILKLWHDPSFFGSFRGVRTFQKLLKTDLNIDVPESRLLQIFKTDPLFLIHLRPKRKFRRRAYTVNFYGQLVQIDLAYMFPDSDTHAIYFLLAIDVFSFKIFAEPLKDKSAEAVLKALNFIFRQFKQPIYEIQADRGKEFVAKPVKKFFKEHKVVFSPKYGKNKASFAEYGILLVKKKLYLLLRSQMKHTWVSFLPKVVESLNNTPLKRLGWLTPNSIHNEASSVLVRNAKKKYNILENKLPTYQVQKLNEKNYSGDLKQGDYVYVDFVEKLFDKSFDVSVRFSLKSLLVYSFGIAAV